MMRMILIVLLIVSIIISSMAADCSRCCPNEKNDSQSLACCEPDGGGKSCLGLPCCAYDNNLNNPNLLNGCLAFTGCRNSISFCRLTSYHSYLTFPTAAPPNKCTEFDQSTGNVWQQMMRNKVNITLNPNDYTRFFFNQTTATPQLKQLLIALPTDWRFYGNHTNRIRCAVWMKARKTETTCAVYNEQQQQQEEEEGFIRIDLPAAASSTEDYAVEIEGLLPAGFVEDKGNQMTRIHFVYDSVVYSSFLRVAPMRQGSLTSGLFIPENLFPGFIGKATLSFYSEKDLAVNVIVSELNSGENSINAKRKRRRIATYETGVIVKLRFPLDWQFTAKSKWSFNGLDIDDATHSFVENELNQWQLGIPFDIRKVNKSSLGRTQQIYPKGWLTFKVEEVKNPPTPPSTTSDGSSSSSNYRSRFPVQTVSIWSETKLERGLIGEGEISVLPATLNFGSGISSYNYVSIVIFLVALVFCAVVTRKNLLSFSLLHLWTNITALCALLSLSVDIVNNVVWVFYQSGLYFYLSRLRLCFTFTMLLAVAFHWKSVLELKTNRLASRFSCILFSTIAIMFYVYQLIAILLHSDLIGDIYEIEIEQHRVANQACNLERVFVFSDLQPRSWFCYNHQIETQKSTSPIEVSSDSKIYFYRWFSISTYSCFVVLTVVVMVFGVKVMRKAKLLNVGNVEEIKQAIRVYYSLVGLVTCTYVVAWILSISFNSQEIDYSWWYIFVVWLPNAIPPCGFVFLQWDDSQSQQQMSLLNDLSNHPHQDERKGNNICQSPQPNDGCSYYEIDTPTLRFSHVENWSTQTLDQVLAMANLSNGYAAAAGFPKDQLVVNDDDNKGDLLPPNVHSRSLGVNLRLEAKKNYSYGCFVKIEAFLNESWVPLNNTDSVISCNTTNKDQFVYHYMSVPHLEISSSLTNIPVRFLVYEHIDDQNNQLKQQRSRLVQRLSTITSNDTSSGSGSSSDLMYPDILEEIKEDELMMMLQEEEEEEDEEDDEEQELKRASMNRRGSVGHVTRRGSEDIRTSSNSLSRFIRCVSEFTTSWAELLGSSQEKPPCLFLTFESSDVLCIRAFNESPQQLSPINLQQQQLQQQQPINHTISRQFNLQQQSLVIVEDLTESAFSNRVPHQMLQQIIQKRMKQFVISQHDEQVFQQACIAYHQQGVRKANLYERLLEQIQEEGDMSNARFWLQERIQRRHDYLELLKELRRVILVRDQSDLLFKKSTEKKKQQLRFLPINLQLQEMWVGPANYDNENTTEDDDTVLYDTVTVGAMAAHVYKFKYGGLRSMQHQLQKSLQAEANIHNKCTCESRDQSLMMSGVTNSIIGDMAEYSRSSTTSSSGSTDGSKNRKNVDLFFYQPNSTLQNNPFLKLHETKCAEFQQQHHNLPSPMMWSESVRKIDDLLWEMQLRMDVCVPQAVAMAVTSLSRKVDLALQDSKPERGRIALKQMQQCGFVVQVESLLSTHGHEIGMLEDMSVALEQLERIKFVLIEEDQQHINEEEAAIGGVVDVSIHTSLAQTLTARTEVKAKTSDVSLEFDHHEIVTEDDQDGVQEELLLPSQHEDSNESSNSSGIGEFFTSFKGNTKKKTSVDSLNSSGYQQSKEGIKHQKDDLNEENEDQTTFYIRVVVRTNGSVELPSTKNKKYMMVQCHSLLFTQGINERQTIANTTGGSITNLQHEINVENLAKLRRVLANYYSFTQLHPVLSHFFPPKWQVGEDFRQLEKTIAAKMRRKCPEVLQLSSHLCRSIGCGRVTVCKSAKDRTGMSVTLEQGKLLVEKHGLPPNQMNKVIAAMRSQGVRLENARKNTGKKQYAFNALQRSLLPDEYRCPPDTGGRNVS